MVRIGQNEQNKLTLSGSRFTLTANGVKSASFNLAKCGIKAMQMARAKCPAALAGSSTSIPGRSGFLDGNKKTSVHRTKLFPLAKSVPPALIRIDTTPSKALPSIKLLIPALTEVGASTHLIWTVSSGFSEPSGPQSILMFSMLLMFLRMLIMRS